MKKELLVALAWGGGIVLLSLAASFARTMGYIDEDTMLRVVAMNGLMVAYYGNLAPKTIARPVPWAGRSRGLPAGPLS